MPAGNKGGSGQGQQRSQHNGGIPREPEKSWDVGPQIREGVEAVSNRLHEQFDNARDGLGEGYRRAEGMVARYPAPSLLVGFGLGFGLGIILCQLIGHEQESWTERNIAGPIRGLHVPDHMHHLADAIVGRLPHSVRQHLG